jgi:hypothetical protein
MKNTANRIGILVNYMRARLILARVVCCGIIVFEAAIFTSTIKVVVANDDGFPDLADPLIGESPTPGTELRFEYIAINSGTADEIEVHSAGELAIMPGVSIEVDVPYKFRDPSDGGSSESNFDVTEIALKLAMGLNSRSLIGGGLELGLPTGDDGKNIGSNNELVVKPFLDVGIMSGLFEYIGVLGFEIPFNEDAAERSEKDLGLEYNFSLAYWFADEVRGVFELDGELVAFGDDNEAILNASWGFIGSPIQGVPLELGVGLSMPVTRDRDFDQRGVISLAYEF